MTWLYPFLVAAVRVLYRADRNPGYVAVDDLFVVLAVTLAGVGAVYALARQIFRDRAEGRLPALCAFLMVAFAFWFDPMAAALPSAPHRLSHVALALVAVAGSVLLVRWFARRPRLLGTAATFLTLTAGLLVVRSAASIALHRKHERAAIAGSALARDLARPIPGPASAPSPARDVYLVVLDEYANAAVLRDLLGFDNHAFEDSLRALGFHVPASAGSNYTQTGLSLPSLLNASHVYRAARDLPEGANDPTLMDHILGRSRVARFLQARGYRYIVFPSLWWGATRASPIADSVVRVWDGFDPGRELSRTEYRRVLRRSTIIDYLHRDDPYDRDFVRRTLDGVARLPSAKGPVFAFAHLISPHSPYVFDRTCGPTPRYKEGGNRPGGRAANYLGQLQCLNGMILATVTRLIRDSETPPVILLQGDHGTAVLRYSKVPSAEQVPAEAAWERFGAFGAYYLPEGGAAAFGDTVTVVNVLGNVLRHYFGADLPREPDELYLSIEALPYHFLRVDPAWLAGGHPVRPLQGAEARR